MTPSSRARGAWRILDLVYVLLVLMLTYIPQVSSMTSQAPGNSSLPPVAKPNPQPVQLDPGPIPHEKIESKPVQPNEFPALTEKEGGGRYNNRSMNNNRNYPESSEGKENGTVVNCELSTLDPEVYTTIKTMVDSGGAKLLEYDIDFPEYNINPLLVNMSNNFRASKWSRAFTKHGRTLLSLSFNYAELSLTMLSFGVEKVKVELTDLPKGCFGRYSADKKLQKIMEVVMSDFRSEIEDPQWVGDFDYACHEVIEDSSGHASFEYKCYERQQAGHRIHIQDNESTKWVNVLFRLILLLKIIVFLVGPTVLSSSFQKFDYEVELRDPLFNSLLVTEKHCNNKTGLKGELQYFPKFKKKVDKLPRDEVQLISFRKLHITVDNRRLMTVKSVPVGLLRFLYSNIVSCGLRRWQPFVTCCTESIFGSWSPNFLWMPLKKEVNTHGKDFLKWKHIFKVFGGIFLLVCLPIPYYIRLVIFHVFEKAEIDARKVAIHKLGLHYPWEHTLIHYVDPTHPAMITLYCVYGLSFIILGIVRSTNFQVFEPVAMGAIRNMQQVKMMECFRLMVAHFILPYEKCGICGLLIWIIYWPIAMVFSMIVAVCYCTPTLYLLGRFLIQSRTRLLRNFPKPTPKEYYNHNSEKIQTLSNGTSSFETCLLLENVSEGKKEITTESCWSCGTKQGKARFITFMIGLLCCILMVSVLILFVDVLGFAVEVFVFTMMGAIVNASKASKYVMLFFWIIIYASACFNNVYKKYMVLNGHVFKFIKEKLDDRMKNVTILSEETQKNVAFKFFTQDDLEDLQQKEMNATEDSDSEDDGDNINVYYGNCTLKDDLTRKHLRLNWRINNLVMFLDRYDIPHIPRDLFYDICDLEGPGYPGPVHRSLLEAFKQLGYMTMFLGFVIITVMTFGEAYKISSTNQLMVTLAGGFIPFIIRTVIKPKEASLDLNSYSFEAKLHQIIYRFRERWPVNDISFKVESKEEVTVMPTENRPRANGASKRGPFDRPLIPFIDEAGSDGTTNRMNGHGGIYFKSTETQTASEKLIKPLPTPTSFRPASTQTPILEDGSHVDIKVDWTKGRVLVDKQRVQQSCSARKRDLCKRGPRYQMISRMEDEDEVA